MRVHAIHVDNVSWSHTYKHNYCVFLVVTISVGLAQARPNKSSRHLDKYTVIFMYIEEIYVWHFTVFLAPYRFSSQFKVVIAPTIH